MMTPIRCPIAYDHDPDGPDCAVCGWSSATPRPQMEPEEWEGIKAWIAALNSLCPGPSRDGE